MKKIWVKIKEWDKPTLLSAIEAGADAIWIEENFIDEVKQLSMIPVISQSEKADFMIGKDVFIYEIQSPEDQEKIINLSKEAPVLVRTRDWHIIPLENLVARSQNIFVEVKDLESARLALGVLERGVAGLVLEVDRGLPMREVIRAVKAQPESLQMTIFQIEDIRPIGLGHRVCVDTCGILEMGEGLLVGDSSRGLFLVHGETISGPYADPRPFRVNAGAVHSYVMSPGQKTRYLAELTSGSEVLVCDFQGNAKVEVVGRSKIERRPLLKIMASYEGEVYSVILQNAETIRLVDMEGRPKSVTGLRPGDHVVGVTTEQARHFGYKVDEWIKEV